MEEEIFNRNIVLTGMSGAGKTYIGKKLAKLLAHFVYFDIDEKIEEKTCLTISEIFEKYSEGYFRGLENEMIKEISQGKNQIISIGGGAFENPENIKNLKQNGIVFYLKAPAKELFNRVENETHRPLLNENFSLKTIENMLKKREKNYLKADFVIDTNQKQAYTILDDILKGYEDYVKRKILC
ncbi:MAG: shikimate kinase [Candidatus Gastranaerophilaceae bacterium]